MSEAEKESILEKAIRKYAEDHDISYEQALKEALNEARGMDYEKGKVSERGVKKLINTEEKPKNK